MAVEFNGKKTEHNGAKNSSHDKPARRADLKAASRKIRRAETQRLADQAKNNQPSDDRE